VVEEIEFVLYIFLFSFIMLFLGFTVFSKTLTFQGF